MQAVAGMARTLHLPLSSRPLLPALPLICIYSPDVTQRNAPPSNLRTLVNTTVLAGMLRPGRVCVCVGGQGREETGLTARGVWGGVGSQGREKTGFTVKLSTSLSPRGPTH